MKLRARRVNATRASADTARRSGGLLYCTALARPRSGTDDARWTRHNNQVSTLAPRCLSSIRLHLMIVMVLMLLEDLAVVHMVVNVIVVSVVMMLLLDLGQRSHTDG